MIKIQTEPIDVEWVRRSVDDELCGAAVLFLGTTRKLTAGRETLRLEYDCYEPMAVAELEKLRKEAMGKWPIVHCAIVHRIGVVENGQASVIVAVSSPHRKEAFEASQWILDHLKQRVPIWKKEDWSDGSSDWVHPETSGPK